MKSINFEFTLLGINKNTNILPRVTFRMKPNDSFDFLNETVTSAKLASEIKKYGPISVIPHLVKLFESLVYHLIERS